MNEITLKKGISVTDAFLPYYCFSGSSQESQGSGEQAVEPKKSRKSSKPRKKTRPQFTLDEAGCSDGAADR